MVSDKLNRAQNARNDVLEKITYDRGFTERLNQRKKENEVLHKTTLEYRNMMHEKQRNFESELKDAMAKKNPFNVKVNEMSLTSATKRRQSSQVE